MSPLRASVPVELSSFVGRERELQSSGALLRESRLVTMTGVGGSGKTRLALELVTRLQGELRAEAAFVGLAPLTDPGLIAPTILQALGVVESGHRSAEAAVVLALRDTETLLLLDNCEHLIEKSAGLVERLLKSSPGLRVLATSREPLDVPGEVTFPVPPLSSPPLEGPLSAATVTGFEAIRLFEDRAHGARPAFAVEDSNAEAIARICHRLDGLPLAIELAAARIRSMSPDEVLERLEDRFSPVTRAGRAHEPRHQTLRATIDWSHDLLTERERVLFRRLSAFRGGWTLHAVEAVCRDPPLETEDIVDLHSRLVDRSLVVSDPKPAGPTRHRLLETIRQYAAERLESAGETEGVRRRHFGHFLDLAEAYDRARMTRGSDGGLAALSADRDNFRAALSWSVEADPDGCLRLTAALDDLWRMISAAEGWTWLQRTLPASSPGSPHRVRALLAAGMLAAYVPAYAEGTGLLRQAAAEAGEVGDPAARAWAELWLGRLAFFAQNVTAAEDHLRRALAQHVELEIPLGRVRSLALLGLLEALVLERHAEGRRELEEAAALAEEIGDSWGQGYAHLMLGLAAADVQDLEEAATHARTALGARSLGPILGVPLQVMAREAVDRDPGRAARLLGAAAGHFERTGTIAPPFVRDRADATRQRAEDLLGRDAVDRRFESGRAMGTDQAIAYALEEEPPPSRSPGLTSRELQVAALVARGMTNRDIARTLHISVRTAESHVDHSLTKLGLSNRTQLAAWAMDHGPAADDGVGGS